MAELDAAVVGAKAQAAGGASDLLMRLVTQRAAEPLGQPFIVDNRPGAGGNIGAELAAKTAPDGYTLLMVSAPHAACGEVRLYDRLFTEEDPEAGGEGVDFTTYLNPS